MGSRKSARPKPRTLRIAAASYRRGNRTTREDGGSRSGAQPEDMRATKAWAKAPKPPHSYASEIRARNDTQFYVTAAEKALHIFSRLASDDGKS